MFTLRPLCWPEDREPLRTLDTSFTTDRIYRLLQTGKSFTLEEMLLDSPLQKVYPFAESSTDCRTPTGSRLRRTANR